MQQIYMRTRMPKRDFSKAAQKLTPRHGCSPANFLPIFRTTFPGNTSGGMLPDFLKIHCHTKYFKKIYPEVFSFLLLKTKKRVH